MARRAKGEGSIFKSESDGRWKALFWIDSDTRIGKSAKTQKEVRDWLIEQQDKKRKGLIVAKPNKKLGEFLDEYMEDVAALNLRQRTYERYTDLIRKHIKPHLGDVKLSKLRADQIQKLYTLKRKEGLSSSTVNYIHAVLHKALNQALKWGYVNKNVADLVDKPKQRKKTFTTWTVDELQQFLSIVEDHRWYPIYVIAAYTGLRQGEILGLHRENVDLDKGVIQVRHQVQTIRGEGLVISEPKTEKAIRPVTLPKTAIEVLKEHLEYVESGLIFTTRNGTPIAPRNLIRHFRDTVKKTDLPLIRFHDLRHTHASLLLAAGVHPKVVQERLGHSQISLTLDTYSHVIPSLQSEAADKFEEIVA